MNRYAAWLLTLFCWDGLLPILVATLPRLPAILLPGQETVEVLTALAIPIAAFFARVIIGMRRFQSGDQYVAQFGLFVLAVFFLIMLDTILVLFSFATIEVTANDWNIWLRLYVIYLGMMGIALFPARTLMAPDTGPSVFESDD